MFPNEIFYRKLRQLPDYIPTSGRFVVSSDQPNTVVASGFSIHSFADCLLVHCVGSACNFVSESVALVAAG